MMLLLFLILVINQICVYHALFIGFAPQDDPKIAIAVAVENAGFGSTWACPIATLIIEQYLTGEIEREWLFERMVNANLIDNKE